MKWVESSIAEPRQSSGSSGQYTYYSTCMIYIILLVLKGYSSGSAIPLLASLEDCNTCCHCLCKPCIIELPPNFLVGSGPPHLRNQEKRFKLYRQFWKLLGSLGLWQDERYLDRKREKTITSDRREIIPSCIVSVSTSIQFSYIMYLLRKSEEGIQTHPKYHIQIINLHLRHSCSNSFM